MRRSVMSGLIFRCSIGAAVFAVLPVPAQAQMRPNPNKYAGPQCFATVIPEVVESRGRITAGREPSMQIFSSGDVVFLEPGGVGLRVGETYLLYRIDGLDVDETNISPVQAGMRYTTPGSPHRNDMQMSPILRTSEHMPPGVELKPGVRYMGFRRGLQKAAAAGQLGLNAKDPHEEACMG